MINWLMLQADEAIPEEPITNPQVAKGPRAQSRVLIGPHFKTEKNSHIDPDVQLPNWLVHAKRPS